MFCTQCGKKNPPSAQFCFSCGRTLFAASEAVPSPAEPGPAPSPGMGTVGQRGDAETRPLYAGFWIRAAASVIDSLLITGISVAGAIVFAAAGLVTDTAGGAAVAGYYWRGFSARGSYFALCESSSKQATVGKRVQLAS